MTEKVLSMRGRMAAALFCDSGFGGATPDKCFAAADEFLEFAERSGDLTAPPAPEEPAPGPDLHMEALLAAALEMVALQRRNLEAQLAMLEGRTR